MAEIKFRRSFTQLFDRHWVISFLIFWMLASYILNTLITGMWEAGMVIFADYCCDVVFTLDARSLILYKAFYSSIATGLAFSLALLLLLNSTYPSEARARFRKRNAVTNSFFTSGYFAFWFLQGCFLLLVLNLTIPLHFDIDFLNEFPYLLFLLPVTAFLVPLMGLQRLRLERKWSYIGISILLFIGLAVGNILLNPIEVLSLNRRFSPISIHEAFQLEIPHSEYRESAPGSNLVDIFMTRDSTDFKNQPLVFYENIDRDVSYEEAAYEFRRKEVLDEFRSNSPVPVFHIDANIELKEVNQLLEKFRSAYPVSVYFSTYNVHSTYPPFHPVFFHSGLKRTLHPKDEDLIAFLDSAEMTDLSNKRIRGTEFHGMGIVKNYNRIRLEVTAEKIHLNGQEIAERDLKIIVRKFVLKYSPRYIIIYEPHTEISFGRYIKILDHVITEINQIRIEMSRGEFNGDIDPYYTPPEIRNLFERYPMNILEWSPEDVRLIKLMEKTNSK